ncbi:MAG: hypothetical protein AAAFM81_03475 [Pseudomonadota bacterium]
MKAHDWFAVGIDFVIVVIGVFIGIQVANWNDVQTNQADLKTSLQRLSKEVTQNTNVIDKVLGDYDRGRANRNLARKALDSCNDSPEARAALDRLLFDLVGDVQPNFSFVVLEQLAGEGRYQGLLSEAFQEEFGSYTARVNEEYEQLGSHYERMWSHHVIFHPSVDAYFPGDIESSDGDWGFRLAKPFSETCADPTFRSLFINTIGFYQSIGNRLQRLRAEIEPFQAALEAEIQRL